MRSRWKRVGLLLVSLGVFATLTGCTSATAAHPSLSPTPVAARSTPSPTPAPPAIDTVVIRPTGIDLIAAGTTRATLPYTDSADVFMAQLAIVFGRAATEIFHASTDFREADITLYDWPGLRIADEHRKVGGPGPSPDGPPTLSLVATKPIVGIGVHIRTIQGIQPGDSVTSAAATLGVDPTASVYFEVTAETGPVLGSSRVTGQINAAAVAVSQSVADPSVVDISAPYNFGDGHDI